MPTGSGATGGVGCAAPEQLCDGACVDTLTDPGHCGQCAKACEAGIACEDGACQCPEGLTDCSGACVDTASDPASCGACGHDCQGGACSAGSCAPVVLASGQESPRGLAIDATHVYWTTSSPTGAVKKVAKGGGAETSLATGQNDPRRVAVDGANVYWSNYQGGVVQQMPKGGGSAVVLASGQNNPYGLAANATDVYWVNLNGGNALMRVPIGGGAAALLVTNNGGGADVVLDAKRAYFTTTPGSVLSFDLTGGTQSTIATLPTGPFSIDVDATDVYFSDYFNGNVFKAPKAGGGEAVALASGLGGSSADGLAIDATHVYWVEWTSSTVKRIPKSGGAPELLASNQGHPEQVVVDKTTIYWTSPQNGMVMKLAK